MTLPHLALTVIEDPGEPGRFHWLLLAPTGDGDRVQEFSTSEHSFGAAGEAFDAGAVRWRVELSRENEDADPVGDAGVG